MVQAVWKVAALCTFLGACQGGLRGARTTEPKEFPKPRIRREIRTLAKSQREAVFAALNIMKNTSQEEGEQKYGPSFLNYDRMVLLHIRASEHPRCDQGHLGPGFFTFHRGIELLVENSLVAVDPMIEGLPYWDMSIDFQMEKPRESIIWSDEYFGENSGDPNDMNQIRNGQFKHWHVNANASELMAKYPIDPQSSDQSPELVQSFNFLRGLTNLQYAPRLTRKNTSCGVDSMVTTPPGHSKPEFPTARENYDAKAADWDRCFQIDPDEKGMMHFFDCANKGPHGFYHPWLGGMWGAKDGKCSAKQSSRATSDIYKGCLVCPRCQPGEECLCQRNESRCQELLETKTCVRDPISGECMTCGEDCADGELGANGDGYDTASSPNDPLFVFHHANVDRLLAEWQLRVQYSPHAPLPFSGWPTEGMCQGHNLHDVISERDPYFGSLLGWTGEAVHKRLTVADLLEATAPGMNSFYTYDSLVGEANLTIPSHWGAPSSRH